MFVISTVQLSLINGLIVNFMNLFIAEANLTTTQPLKSSQLKKKRMFKSCPPAICSVLQALLSWLMVSSLQTAQSGINPWPG